jgi:hypothetical protein
MSFKYRGHYLKNPSISLSLTHNLSGVSRSHMMWTVIIIYIVIDEK